VRFEERRSLYSSSYSIKNLNLILDNGERLRLVLKDVSPSSLLPAARKIRPSFWYDQRRELETYQRLLDFRRIGTPVFYGSSAVPEINGYWLILERVKGPLLWQLGGLESWESAAEWLAAFHSEYDSNVCDHSEARFAHLLRLGPPQFNQWLARAEAFLKRRHGLDLETLRRFGRLADRYDRVVNYLAALRCGCIHGEFYPSNIIVRAGSENKGICPIDWEVAGIGPVLFDLSALASGDWHADDKRKFAMAYRERTERHKDWPPPISELLEHMRMCQLHLCIQWLGWASEWSPPRDHGKDWLAESLKLAEAAGV
jgi:aminoglycoside phosphotransferase (APT) family kinase protein